MDFSKNFVLLVFDTETTGLKSTDGNRVVDFAVQALLWNASAESFELLESAQWYFNPERTSEPGAARVHRLSKKFLADQPLATTQIPAISAWVDALVARVDAKRGISGLWLAAHNAIFDVGFTNTEVQKAGLEGSFARLLNARGVLCTKAFSRNTMPFGKVSQNAFCEWVGVDTTSRYNDKGEEVHGALVDCQLLAQAIIAAHGKLGSAAFATACQKSLLDAVSLTCMDSLGTATFCEYKEAEPKKDGSKTVAATPAKKPEEGEPKPKEMTPEEIAQQALKDKCAGALADFKQKSGDITAFEAALWKSGVRLRLSFADDYRRIAGTQYTDGEQTLSGSAIGKDFSAKAVMELTGYQRVRHWALVQRHLPLMVRLRSLPLEPLLLTVMSIDDLPALPLPDADTIASYELQCMFKRAGAIYQALESGSLQREQVSTWLGSLRQDVTSKPFADSVALFVNGFHIAARLHTRGWNMREQIEHVADKLAKDKPLDANDEIVWMYQGAMLLCEMQLPHYRGDAK